MSNFEKLYNRFSKGKIISPELKPLLEEFYRAYTSKEFNRNKTKDAIINLMTFLSGQEGRIRDNLVFVSLFTAIDDDWEISDSYEQIPEDYLEILGYIEGSLDDTIDNPDIAENFGGLPEQILEKARELK